jgi:exopolyphosphatase/guanosine-5'-triphosphate,3'-diphosphate pyrophosphatase
MTERIAIIDLGSNSARLIVMHVYYNGAYNLIYHQKENVRLSEGLDKDNMLQPESINRAIDSLKVFAHMCELFSVDIILASATAAVRSAKNGQEFLQKVYQETNIPLKVISGEAEAHLGYLAAINTLNINDALLFDLGGASTELTLIKDRKPRHVVSLPFGAVNLTEKFNTNKDVSEKQLGQLKNFITKQLNQISWLKNISLPLIGIGGTARNLAKIDQKQKNYPFPKIHNYRLGAISLDELWKNISNANNGQRSKIRGLSSDRNDIIVAGTSLVKCLFDITRAPNLVVSSCGVREGMFLKHYLGKKGYEEIISDILLHSAHNMMLFYKANAAHAYHVSKFAETMFDGWQPLHKMEPRDKELLRAASLLHDIGITINYYDHARHSTYLIENAKLFGLTHREQILTAIVAGWHHGQSAKYYRNRVYTEFLDEASWAKARKLALLLALAESLDTTQSASIEKIEATFTKQVATLKLTSSETHDIEKQAAEKCYKKFRKEFGLELTLEG